jgi:hypothetical protein
MPPNRDHTAVRKGSLEATQQYLSTCKERRRYGYGTVVIKKGGVKAGNRVGTAMGLSYSRKRMQPHSRVKDIA